MALHIACSFLSFHTKSAENRFLTWFYNQKASLNGDYGDINGLTPLELKKHNSRIKLVEVLSQFGFNFEKLNIGDGQYLFVIKYNFFLVLVC